MAESEEAQTVEAQMTIAREKVAAMTARPPFNAIVAGTSGRILVEKSEEQVVLNLSDLSAIAAVHGLRVLVSFAMNLQLVDDDHDHASLDLVGWDIEWKPAEDDKPWGVFA